MTTTDRYDSLNGQVALVTGATRGIGEQIAAQRTERGATVYAGARDTADDQRPVEPDVTEDETMQAPGSPAKGEDTPVWLATFAPASPAVKCWRNREQIDV